MHLKDSLSQKNQIVGHTGDPIKIYSCGPTVYDYPHLGNWYAFLRWDLLVRTLKSLGFQTIWVMNITDVGHLVSDADEGEDKLVKKAKLEKKTAYDIADFYTDYFLKSLKRLNFSTPNYLPKATQHIEQQIDLVERLAAKNLTYLIDDGVYYDTSKIEDYGKLCQTDRKGLQPGARVDFNPQKRNATDFALWKLTPSGQKMDMEWDSPWGRGFPGWHLECSAMCHHYLDLPIDIHTGGIDHIPIHHTNELAQSEAGYDKQLAKIWLHSNFITVNGDKMSKSLNNFYTLEDIEAKGYDLDALRLAVFSVRYNKLTDFNWDLMDVAAKRLNKLRALAARSFQLQNDDDPKPYQAKFESTLKNIKDALADDLNSPRALEYLDAICQDFNCVSLPKNIKTDLQKFLLALDNLWGLKLSQVADLTSEQRNILNQRQEARLKDDFTACDQLRKQLSRLKINVSDTDLGQIWQPL